MSGRVVTLYAENAPAPSLRERFAENKLHRAVFGEFETEGGDKIVNLKVVYRVFGRPNETKDNVIFIFHALSGDANVAGYIGKEGAVSGWWDELFGCNGAIDLEKWCVICPNHPGSCYGSSGPLDIEIGGEGPLGPQFPAMTVRDAARAHRALMEYMGLSRLKCVIGGSFGGMIALEWAIMFPEFVERAAIIAAPLANNASSLAYNHIQRKCLENDPNFKGGRYYEGERPIQGLSLARQVAMITYRSPDEFTARFGRETNYRVNERRKFYEIQSYLDHQGKKLVKRFDANSYIRIMDMIDDHDISRGRGSFADALSAIKAKLLFISVDSDVLYTPAEINSTNELCLSLGIDSKHQTIKSLHGHDGFLIESAQLNSILKQFVEN